MTPNLRIFLNSKQVLILLVMITMAIGLSIGNYAVDVFRNTKQIAYIDYVRHFGPDKKIIVVLGSEKCQFCKETLKYFRSRGVSLRFIDLDASEDGRHLMRDLRANSIPQVIIGDTRIQGYWPSLYEKALKGIS